MCTSRGATRWIAFGSIFLPVRKSIHLKRQQDSLHEFAKAGGLGEMIMADGSRDRNATWVGAVSALGGFVTLAGAFVYVLWGGGLVVERWQGLGMLAVVVVIAFAVVAMLRFALAPLIAAKSSAAAADADKALRSRIAPLVLTIGSIAIVALALGLIITFAILATAVPPVTEVRTKIDTLLTGVFSTVLPVLATWVGTVLAFYFGSENFRQAAQSTRDVLSDQQTVKKKITDIMVPFERIAQLSADDEEKAGALKMEDVIHAMSEAATRIIVFDKKAQTPIYVIRSGPPMPKDWITAEYKVGKLSENKTIKDYLEADAKNKTDATNFRFIDENATREAALALMAREGVDDVFITKDGQKTGRVLGWATTHDLLKK